MTTRPATTRAPLAVLGSIVILVFVHSLTQESPAQFSRTLPFLLAMILSELCREWTVGRLAPTTDLHVLRRRRRYQWFSLLAGMASMTLSVIGSVRDWWPSRGAWGYVLFAGGMIGFGAFAGLLLVRSQAAAIAKRAQMVRAGEQPVSGSPGPFVFLFVFSVALLLFLLANATAIEALVSQHALNSRQWIRIIVSAVLCGGLAFVAMHKVQQAADRPFDSANPDPT